MTKIRFLLPLLAAIALVVAPAAAQAAPEVTNLQVTYGTEEAHLSWSPSTPTNLLAYLPEEKIGAGSFTKLPELSAAITTLIVKPLPAGPVTFRIWAIVKNGMAESTGTVLAKEVKEEPPKEEVLGAGHAKYRLNAASFFDPFAGEATWIKAHIARILGYPAFADHYVPLVSTVAYHDAYTTWGANSLNASHRAEYGKWVERDRGVGYAGQFMDDIEWSKASGQHIPGSEEETAKLIEAVRAALGPSGVLELNTQYADLWPRMKEGDPFVARALAVTNMVDKEFGVASGSGINSPAGYAEFFSYVEALRSKAIHIDLVSANAGDEYSLATYFLLNDGGDYIGAHTTPSTWWKGFEVELGAATSPRERVSTGIWVRHFSGGVVYTEEPGGSSHTVILGKSMKNANGQSVTQVTLTGGQGAVLVG